jgi:hypothetical protein
MAIDIACIRATLSFQYVSLSQPQTGLTSSPVSNLGTFRHVPALQPGASQYCPWGHELPDDDHVQGAPPSGDELVPSTAASDTEASSGTPVKRVPLQAAKRTASAARGGLTRPG